MILDWAIADYHFRDWLGLTVGNMKFVHGLYNETRDLDMVRTFILLPQSVYIEAWREAISSIQGAGLYGDIGLSDMGSLSYDLQYGTVNLDSDKGAARLLEDQWPFQGMGLLVDVDRINVDYTYAASIRWITNLEGLILGGSTWGYQFEADGTTLLDTTNPTAAALLQNNPEFVDLVGPLNAYDARFILAQRVRRGGGQLHRIHGVHVEEPGVRRGIHADNLQYRVQKHATVQYPGAGTERHGVAVQDGTIEVDQFSSVGYYTSLAYRFTPWFELGTYYSVYYPNEDDKDGEDRVAKGLDAQDHRGWLKDIALTTRFDVNENWIIKLEAHKMDGSAILLGADNPVPEDPEEDRYEEDWYLFAAKMTFHF